MNPLTKEKVQEESLKNSVFIRFYFFLIGVKKYNIQKL